MERTRKRHFSEADILSMSSPSPKKIKRNFLTLEQKINLIKDSETFFKAGGD